MSATSQVSATPSSLQIASATENTTPSNALWANPPSLCPCVGLGLSQQGSQKLASNTELLHLSFKSFLSAAFMISAQHHANCGDMAAYS